MEINTKEELLQVIRELKEESQALREDLDKTIIKPTSEDKKEDVKEPKEETEVEEKEIDEVSKLLLD